MKTVSKIIIYPIKSLNGISVQKAKLTSTGFYNDRKFMLVDIRENKMITLREYPNLYQIKLSFIEDDIIQLENEKHKQAPLFIKLNETESNTKTWIVNVWDDLVEVQSWNIQADKWFSEAIGIKCQLVKMAPGFFRQVDLRYANLGKGVLFSDGFPYLICTETSLETLNHDLKNKVTVFNFRPNILLKGSLPNEEFNWDYIKVNGYTFNSFKPCARCQVISIDPEKQKLNNEILPLMAKKYQKDKKIVFGLNACLETNEVNGEIKVGDSFQSFNKINL